MDEAAVRTSAERHAGAVVAGDLRTAGSDLTTEAQGQAPAVMKNLPKELQSADIVEIAEAGGRFEAHISYKGAGSETVVVSTWEERDGTPKIVNLSLG